MSRRVITVDCFWIICTPEDSRRSKQLIRIHGKHEFMGKFELEAHRKNLKQVYEDCMVDGFVEVYTDKEAIRRGETIGFTEDIREALNGERHEDMKRFKKIENLNLNVVQRRAILEAYRRYGKQAKVLEVLGIGSVHPIERILEATNPQRYNSPSGLEESDDKL